MKFKETTIEVVITAERKAGMKRKKAVKTIEARIVTKKMHCSFQSTSSTNIQAVNSLSKVKLLTVKKSRGAGRNKRTSATEMNNAQQLYLGTYFLVDAIDTILAKVNLNYI